MTVAPTAGSDGAAGATLCRRRQENTAAIQPVDRRPRTVSVVAMAINTASVMANHIRWMWMKNTRHAGIRTAAHRRWPVVIRTPKIDRSFFIGASTRALREQGCRGQLPG